MSFLPRSCDFCFSVGRHEGMGSHPPGARTEYGHMRWPRALCCLLSPHDDFYPPANF